MSGETRKTFMGHPAPHALDSLSRTFDQVWHAIAGNYDAENAPEVRGSLALIILELAGGGERSIDDIRATALQIMSRKIGS